MAMRIDGAGEAAVEAEAEGGGLGVEAQGSDPTADPGAGLARITADAAAQPRGLTADPVLEDALPLPTGLATVSEMWTATEPAHMLGASRGGELRSAQGATCTKCIYTHSM